MCVGARPLLCSALPRSAVRSWAGFEHDAELQKAPTSHAACKVCRVKIPKGSTRVALLCQCPKGYKDPSLAHFVHLPCLGRHPEAHKLVVGEVVGAREAPAAERRQLEDQLTLSRAASTAGAQSVSAASAATAPARVAPSTPRAPGRGKAGAKPGARRGK